MYEGSRPDDVKRIGLDRLMSHRVRLDRSLSSIAAKAASSSLVLLMANPADSSKKQAKKHQQLTKDAKLDKNEIAMYPNLRWMWNFRLGERKELSVEEIRKKLKYKNESKNDQFVIMKRVENQLKATGPLEFLRDGWVDMQKVDDSKVNSLTQWRRLSVS